MNCNGCGGGLNEKFFSVRGLKAIFVRNLDLVFEISDLTKLKFMNINIFRVIFMIIQVDFTLVSRHKFRD